MRQGQALERHSDGAGRTGHELQAAMLVRTVCRVQPRSLWVLLLSRGVFYGRDIFSVEDSLFPELEVQPSAVVDATNVLVSYNYIALYCEKSVNNTAQHSPDQT